MANKPRNIIFAIADSLRYDSVYNGGVGMPYVENNAVQFSEARSAGCWTLPATASLFTGMMPHEHGASSQTRAIHKDIPTLAEKMKAAGYKTYQITANIATTHIFGLDRGFDEVIRIWQHVESKFNTLQKFLVLIGKPRLRAKLMSKDLLMQRMSSDLETAKTWLQVCYDDIFNQARRIIKENEAKGEKSFIFLNLMETHFPYHIAPTFQLSTPGLFKKWRETYSLFHMVNQTFLKQDKNPIKKDMLPVLHNRQRLSWELLAPHMNAFCKEMHKDTGNLMVFGSDHGENFGEDNWIYHFSNVTDGGNKVPMFWLDHNDPSPRTVETPVSTRHIYNSFLKAIGENPSEPCILTDSERSNPVMESFWYNNKGNTMDKYKYNQLCLVVDDERYLLRNDQWHCAPFRDERGEPQFSPLDKNVNPLEELNLDGERKANYLDTARKFKAFSDNIPF